ncbi:B1 bradykinin receptor-like isoform X2 [Periplaneta americana]|uniref:B1 bradykinin receptor-like isoform X2 n=1 Tax=Periplaneta americana TaxID=6978 RepID=UPI0037E7B388
MNSDEEACPHDLSVLDFLHLDDLLEEPNRTNLEYLWPCEVRAYWLELHNLIALLRFLLSYVTVLIIVLGLIMNTVAFIVLSAAPVNASSMSVYLRVLALTDNGVLLFNFAVGVLRSHSTQVNRLYMENPWLCGMHKVMIEMFFLLSTWMVVTLTLERLMVVWCPFRLGSRLNARSASIVVFILSGTLLPVGLTKLQYAGFEVDSSFEYQACDFGTPKEWDEFMYVYIAMTTWVPLFFIILSNVFLLAQLRHSAETRSTMTAGCRDTVDSGSVRTHKTTRTLLLISAMYVVLLLPLAIVETIELYWVVVLQRYPEPDRQLYIEWLRQKILLKRWRGFCFALYQWNFAINFLLYCLSGKKFRNEVFVRLHHCCFFGHSYNRCSVLKQRSLNTALKLVDQHHTPPTIVISHSSLSLCNEPSPEDVI